MLYIIIVVIDYESYPEILSFVIIGVPNIGKMEIFDGYNILFNKNKQEGIFESNKSYNYN